MTRAGVTVPAMSVMAAQMRVEAGGMGTMGRGGALGHVGLPRQEPPDARDAPAAAPRPCAADTFAIDPGDLGGSASRLRAFLDGLGGRAQLPSGLELTLAGQERAATRLFQPILFAIERLAQSSSPQAIAEVVDEVCALGRAIVATVPAAGPCARRTDGILALLDGLAAAAEELLSTDADASAASQKVARENVRARLRLACVCIERARAAAPSAAGGTGWDRIFERGELTVDEARVLASLCRLRRIDLDGGAALMGALGAIVRAGGSGPPGLHRDLREARARIVEGALGRQVAEASRKERQSQRRAEQSAWESCERGERRAALHRLRELQDEAVTRLDELAFLRRSPGAAGQEHHAELQTLLDRTLEACRQGLAVGAITMASEVARLDRAGRRDPRRSRRLYRPPEVFDRVDMLVSQAVASCGRRARATLEIFRHVESRRSWHFPFLPADILNDIRLARGELARRRPADDLQRRRLVDGLGDIEKLVDQVETDAAADSMLHRQVSVLARKGTFIRSLALSVTALAEEIERLPLRKEPARFGRAAEMAVPSTTSSPTRPLIAGRGDEGEAAPPAAAAGASGAEVPASGAAADTAAFALVARRHPRGARQDTDAAARHFDAGTFATPLCSARYHFRKHAAGLAGASLAGYVARALAARAQWDAALRRQEAWWAPDAARDGGYVRVISTQNLWLVMTDEEDAKIISYRDRRGRAYD